MSVLSTILIFLMIQGVSEIENDESFLNQGLILEEKGTPEKALQLWEESVYELQIPSLAIATEYLRVATEYELVQYYSSASTMYSWSVSASDRLALMENESALKKELSRLEPVLNKQKV